MTEQTTPTRAEERIDAVKRDILLAIWDAHEAVWQPGRELKRKDFDRYNAAFSRYATAVDSIPSLGGFPAHWHFKAQKIMGGVMERVFDYFDPTKTSG